MKTFITKDGLQVGRFANFEQLENAYLCDGVEYPFDVLGDVTIGDYVEPVAKLTKQDVENSLTAFASEKDLDGIGEASALLNSTNTQWQNEAQTFIRLWDETWQAFYNNQPLPNLSWL